jgi:hypothetical protein
VTPHEAERDALSARQVAAVEGYRATGDRTHFEVLRMDGYPNIVHALTMERYGDDPKYAAEVDAFLVQRGAVSG